jgi:DNA mismatch endonuclease, patch repair protein
MLHFFFSFCIGGLSIFCQWAMRQRLSKDRKVKTSPERSALMSRIRAKHTQPEMVVRRALQDLGYRFRLHARELPGCPDIVLKRYATIIQIKGCFWHGHSCLKGRLPRCNRFYWLPKLRKNKTRDSANERKLRRMGWKVRTIWECKLKKLEAQDLRSRLTAILSSVRKEITPRRQQKHREPAGIP